MMGLVLGIETSCDETAASVVDEEFHVLSSVIESSIRPTSGLRVGSYRNSPVARTSPPSAPSFAARLSDAGLDPTIQRSSGSP